VRTEERNRRSLHSATPDFLSSLLALANFMRLSLRKARIRGLGWYRDVGNPGPLRSKNISTKGLRSGKAHSRSLGYARDDKGEGGAHLSSRYRDRQSRRLSAIFISLGGPKAHDSSGRMTILLCPQELHREILDPERICHPDRSEPGFPTTQHSSTTTRAAFSKESRIKFASATHLHRSSSGICYGSHRTSIGERTA
jgi:hypothetical protein